MTVRYPVVQFSSSQKPFAAFGNVPIADGNEDQKLTFAVVTRRLKAVSQNSDQFFRLTDSSAAEYDRNSSYGAVRLRSTLFAMCMWM